MVLCLVTLTDLETRRAGLSASAELLVKLQCPDDAALLSRSADGLHRNLDIIAEAYISVPVL